MTAKPIIALIKELRERTGAGMMDCKKALEENDLDVEKAISWLREKGIAKASTRAGRIAAEGLTKAKVCQGCNKGIVVEVNCETDFVSRGDRFINLVDNITKEVLHNEPKDLDEAKALVDGFLTDATVALGEKIDFRRFEIVSSKEGEGLSTYIHMNGKVAVLVHLAKEDEELGRNLAMHIAAMNPTYVSKKDIPAAVVEQEKHIARELAKNDEKLADKPEKVLENIINGKVSKQLSESTLYEQSYVRDDAKKVSQVLKEHDNQVLKFVRFETGEGIEKKCCDFAEEVMEQIK